MKNATATGVGGGRSAQVLGIGCIQVEYGLNAPYDGARRTMSHLTALPQTVTGVETSGSGGRAGEVPAAGVRSADAGAMDAGVTDTCVTDVGVTDTAVPGARAGGDAGCAGCGGHGGPTRRGVLRGVAAAGVLGAAGIGLAACTQGGGAPAASGPTTLGPTGDVPLKGGKLYQDQKVVVTQPSAGVFKAFSAICTHQGCVVAGVQDGLIECPCHGSEFRIADGSVAQGPATKPLPSRPVAVEAGKLVVTL